MTFLSYIFYIYNRDISKALRELSGERTLPEGFTEEVTFRLGGLGESLGDGA